MENNQEDENKIIPEHIEQTLIIDYSIVPEHKTRANKAEQKAFDNAKNIMKKDGYITCFICGCQSTPKNRIEYHHFLAEDCFANVTDMNKLWELAKILDVYGYANKATEAPLSVNHPMNLIPLCHKHHTGAEGIHSNTFSTFIIQKLIQDVLDPGEDNPVPQDMEKLKELKQQYEDKIKHKKNHNI